MDCLVGQYSNWDSYCNNHDFASLGCLHWMMFYKGLIEMDLF